MHSSVIFLLIPLYQDPFYVGKFELFKVKTSSYSTKRFQSSNNENKMYHSDDRETRKICIKHGEIKVVQVIRWQNTDRRFN